MVGVALEQHHITALTYKRVSCSCGFTSILPIQKWGDPNGKDILLDEYNDHKRTEEKEYRGNLN